MISAMTNTVSNTETYTQLLANCIANPVTYDNTQIAYEILAVATAFNANGLIQGTVDRYVKHELNWYTTQDLYIIGHDGIANNSIWQSCATDEGHVNSNYGWCIFSIENGLQFTRACRTLIEDNNTKHACMVYTRPSINTEWNDGVHANSDMICTMYTSTLLRDGKLIHNVHMRSNDIWYGLRNDLAWQQHVQRLMYDCLTDNGVSCMLGPIVWHADSLHLYNRNVDDAVKYLHEHMHLLKDN